ATGKSCILISHLLGEVLRHADRIVVMRDGAVAAADAVGAFDRDSLVAVMGGEESRTDAGAGNARPMHEARARRVRARPARQLDGAELVANEGEIVGLAGLS